MSVKRQVRSEFSGFICKDLLKSKIEPSAFYLLEGHEEISKPNYEGWATAGTCPFCKKEGKGHFRFNVEHGGFYCFGCRKKGDLIRYTMLKYQMSYKTALQYLAEEWGYY